MRQNHCTYNLKAMLLCLVAVLSMAAGLVFVPATMANAAAPSCANGGVNVVFARGSGEHLNDQRAHQFYWSLIGDAEQPGAFYGKVPTVWSELGNEDGSVPVSMRDMPEYDGKTKPKPDGSNEYPAVGDAAAAISVTYSDSVKKGSNELVNYLNDRAVRCPTETFVAGGYSQGADLLGWTLQRSELTKAARDHFGYVALYGDSKFNAGPLSDRKNNTNVATKWWWVQGDDSGYRLKMINSVPTYVSNNGYYKARVPYATSEFKGRFGSWCDKGDGICTGKFFDGTLFGTHGSAYQDKNSPHADGWISKSASVIATAALAKVNQLNPKPSPTTSTAPAQSVGATIWNTELTDMSANDLTAYSGGVMVNACSGSGRSFVGLNNSGVVNNRGFVQSETARYGKCIVGKNGVVYAELVSHDSNNYNPATYRYDIVAFSGGSVLWKTELTGNTLGTWRSVGQMVIGVDGNLYTLLTDGGKTRQAGFDYATGKTLFDVAVDGNSYFLLPYKLGIIMWPMYSGQARYFDYRGNQRLAFTPTFIGSVGRRVYSADGDVFVMSYQPRKSGNKCRYATVGWQMTKFTTNGAVAWSSPVTACAMVGSIYSTPSGGVIATSTSGNHEWMVAFDATGKQLWNRDLGALAVNWSNSTIVDTHGNVVFRQIYSTKSGEAVKFNVMSGTTGQTTATFNTESAGLGSYRLEGMASASDKLFVGFNKTCSTTCNTSKVYAFFLPGIGASYPGILG